MEATTGVCRVLKDAHWFYDVLVGAGIGILSVDLTYFVFDKLGSKTEDFTNGWQRPLRPQPSL